MYRFIETKVVSKIGTIIIIIGIEKADKVSFADSDVIIKQRIDKVVPRKKLPESPINILAGGKLNIMKPRHDPIKIITILIIS
tara:strand:+ start:222 stop:470 length:249 start_codon:yes stop_codon:yes gene_type:complete